MVPSCTSKRAAPPRWTPPFQRLAVEERDPGRGRGGGWRRIGGAGGGRGERSREQAERERKRAHHGPYTTRAADSTKIGVVWRSVGRHPSGDLHPWQTGAASRQVFS